jgi:hypothetical protein
LVRPSAASSSKWRRALTSNDGRSPAGSGTGDPGTRARRKPLLDKWERKTLAASFGTIGALSAVVQLVEIFAHSVNGIVVVSASVSAILVCGIVVIRRWMRSTRRVTMGFCMLIATVFSAAVVGGGIVALSGYLLIAGSHNTSSLARTHQASSPASSVPASSTPSRAPTPSQAPTTKSSNSGGSGGSGGLGDTLVEGTVAIAGFLGL